MGNLGAYQTFTTFAKKVGGPRNLLLLASAGGAVVYKTGEMVVKKTVKVVRYKLKKGENSETNYKPYRVCVHGISNEGLVFNEGEQFRVLERDGDAVLIEKIGGENNPYFVSAEFLRSISNY